MKINESEIRDLIKEVLSEAKIKAANDVYKEMESPKYKRAVTMYKRRK